jgi:hypothetical protein
LSVEKPRLAFARLSNTHSCIQRRCKQMQADAADATNNSTNSALSCSIQSLYRHNHRVVTRALAQGAVPSLNGVVWLLLSLDPARALPLPVRLNMYYIVCKVISSAGEPPPLSQFTVPHCCREHNGLAAALLQGDGVIFLQVIIVCVVVAVADR